jgi:heme exporter protein C
MDSLENKDRWMHKNYWKTLGIIIMLYVLIGGMTVPLKPGLEEVYGVNSSIKPGEKIALTVKGYNTHFDKAEDNTAFLKLNESHFLKSSKIVSSEGQKLKIDFEIPTEMINKVGLDPLTLVVTNSIDGYALQPNAVSIKWVALDTNLISSNTGQWALEMPKVNQNSQFAFPYRNILNETIRNTFFHIALWLAMIILLLAGLYHAVKYLRKKELRDDYLSASYNTVGILYGMLGLATGSIWAKHTWGTWWTTDVKLNMAAIGMLIYCAYLILRNSTNDFERRAKLSAGFSIFAFVAFIPLIFVIPRLYDSLHPGNGGNPALGGEDLDSTLRMFFYPSIIGLILLGVWLATLKYRSMKLENYLYSKK